MFRMRNMISGENNLRNELHNLEDVMSDYILAILNEEIMGSKVYIKDFKEIEKYIKNLCTRQK